MSEEHPMSQPNAESPERESRRALIREVRQAVADYMWSEGCSCCSDKQAHDAAKARLARLLRVPQYHDGSGYDFYRFATERAKQ
jgi:hypothetical protein